MNHNQHTTYTDRCKDWCELKTLIKQKTIRECYVINLNNITILLLHYKLRFYSSVLLKDQGCYVNEIKLPYITPKAIVENEVKKNKNYYNTNSIFLHECI